MTRSAKFFDGGRSFTKISNETGLTLTIPSGTQEISLADYNIAIDRLKSFSAEYLLINDRAFVVGAHASFYGVLSNKNTAARYRWDDIGISAISAILRYEQESQELDLVVSYPPADYNDREKLKAALLGEWRVASYNKEVVIDIRRVLLEEEPVAILRHSQWTDDGKVNKNSPVRGRCLIIDGGGQTLDIAATDSDGKLVNALIDSRPIGINHYLATFETNLKQRYRDMFTETAQIDPVAIRTAFATGIFYGGGRELDCRSEVQQLQSNYINRYLQFIRDKTGGLMNFDTIILGGGSAGLLNGSLVEALNHGNIHYADDDLTKIHEAGVNGLRKSYAMWKKIKLV